MHAVCVCSSLCFFPPTLSPHASLQVMSKPSADPPYEPGPDQSQWKLHCDFVALEKCITQRQDRDCGTVLESLEWQRSVLKQYKTCMTAIRLRYGIP